ncbi:MAG TPA: alpha-glucan phosphorylase, partial [Acidimicrobiia bacterium]|nr:alpha-glucan phosphorylase [Acidimicrobiia bacterium]
NGWAFGHADPSDDYEASDRHDADDFYRVLADEVAPLYYERDSDGIPHAWVERMRRSIASSLVRFSSHRMVAEYLERAYLPLGRG